MPFRKLEKQTKQKTIEDKNPNKNGEPNRYNKE